MTLATIPAVAAVWTLMQQGEWAQGPTLNNGLMMFMSGLVGGVVYTVAASVLGVTELRQIQDRLLKRFRRR
jgi:xanthine/uracil permease